MATHADPSGRQAIDRSVTTIALLGLVNFKQ
jgi:hypothetical protein